MGTRWKSAVCTRGLLAAAAGADVWGRRGRPPQPAGYGQNHLLPTHLLSAQPPRPYGKQRESATGGWRGRPGPHPAELPGPPQPMEAEVLEEAGGWEMVGCWGFFLISYPGTRYFRNFASVPNAV